MNTELEIIYLFGFSSNTGSHLQRLLPILKAQLNKQTKLGIVLIHDGVIGISTKGKVSKQIEDLLNLDVAIFAMKSDMTARGIAPEFVQNRVKCIEYDDLIDLIDATRKIISWM
ncbi:MAG: sulfurtransferase complex subunit TusB [Promethearchaeota archaeon]